MTEFEFPRRQYQLGGNPSEDQEVWEKAAFHRAMVTRILVDPFGKADAGRAGKLAVLGAGLCNDLNLAELGKRFEEVHLFDLNGPAVWKGVDFQGLTSQPWINIHGDVDVTGLASKIGALDSRRNDKSLLNEVISEANQFRLTEFTGHFDVVASTCLLSQLMDHAISSIGEDHPQLVDLLTSLRQGHFLMLADLCKPGGIGNLIFDFVSSETLPGMVGTSGNDLTVLLRNAVENQNFFHGMNPVRIGYLLANDPALQSIVEKCRMTDPWVWNAGTRHYAVLAARFFRK